MATIYLTYEDSLEEVDDKVAQEIQEIWSNAKAKNEDLSNISKTVNHKNGSVFLRFHMIKTFGYNGQKIREKHTFTNEDGIKRFHELYGDIKPEIKDGYGLLDRNTQFLIKSSQSELVDLGYHKVLRSLNNLKPEAKEKLNDLWKEYNEKHKDKF